MSHKTHLFLALGAALVGSLVQVAIPRVTMAAIDLALVEQTVPLSMFVGTLIALGVLRAGLGFVSRHEIFKTAHGIEYDLRAIIYEHLTRLSFSFYDRVQSGQLISRANSDIRAVQMFLAFAPMMAITMSTFFVALILMIQISPSLAVVAILPLPGVYWLGMRMRRLIFPVSWLVQARLAEVATIVEENLSGIRIVKSFAAETRQIAHLKGAARRLWWAAVRQVDIRARYAPLLENLPRIGLVLVLVYGGYLAIEGEITIGAIVAFSAYVVMLQAPFRMLGFLFMLSERAKASAGRIYEILDTDPAVVDRPDATDLTEPRGEVEFRGVTFGYEGSADILRSFSLRMAPGDTVALVGPTGCGKSTVARLLMRFYDVRDGSVLVEGRDVREYTQTSLRSHIGVVLDEGFLFSDTIRANVAYGRPDAPMEEIEAAARAAGAHGFISELPDGYETLVGERGYTLSGGQRQRISIARTLLTNPRVLILDDATSSVDVKTEQEIHEALGGLMRGRTTLIIAHRLSTISLADRVVLLEDGQVVASGPHRELMASEPRYREILAHLEAAESERAVSEDSADGSQGPPTEEEAPFPRTRRELGAFDGFGPDSGGWG